MDTKPETPPPTLEYADPRSPQPQGWQTLGSALAWASFLLGSGGRFIALFVMLPTASSGGMSERINTSGDVVMTLAILFGIVALAGIPIWGTRRVVILAVLGLVFAGFWLWGFQALFRGYGRGGTF